MRRPDSDWTPGAFPFARGPGCLSDLARPRPLPYFGGMNRSTLQILSGALLALLLAGCSIDEVDDAQRVGTLYFRAVSSTVADHGVPGDLFSSGQSFVSYTSTAGDWLRIDGLPSDSVFAFRFLPNQPGDWLEQPGTRSWRLPEDADVDSLEWTLTPVEAGLYTVTVRARALSGDEIAGLPVELDGSPLEQPTPVVIQFTGGENHTLRLGDDRCVRGEEIFRYDAEPVEDRFVAVDDATLTVSAPGGTVIWEGLDQGAELLELVNPALGVHFFSAYRAGSATTPASGRLDGQCDGDLAFDWTETEAGYVADRLVPDFTLPAVDPVSGASLGELSLRQFRGRLTLLTFWFIDCAACQEEMPHFQDLLDDYREAGFRIVALDPLPNDDPAGFPDYDFHFLTDLGSPPVAQQAQVTAFPTNIVLRPDGTVRSRHGSLSRETLQAILDEYYPAP